MSIFVLYWILVWNVSTVINSICNEYSKHTWHNEQYPFSSDRSSSNTFISSLMCTLYKDKSHYCRVDNLCLRTSTQELLFFNDPERSQFVPENLRHTLNPFVFGKLSPVIDHNRYLISKLVTIPVANENFVNYTSHVSSTVLKNASFVDGDTIIIASFKPDNLMHLIHDDLLPIFATLKFLGLRREETKVWNFGPRLNKNILFRRLFRNIDIGEEFVCFERAFLGLIDLTQWYNYGFLKPQSPVALLPAGIEFIRSTIAAFKMDLLKAFSLENHSSENCPEPTKALVFSRHSNRRIINLEVFEHVENSEIVNISQSLMVNTSEFREVLSKIVCSKLLIGMHGAELILSLFLPINSVLLELFPYGIMPQSVRPYSSLSEIIGNHYKEWNNTKLSDSIYDIDSEILQSQDKDKKKELLKSLLANKFEESMYICCDNPHWLFRIYQDTKVEPTSISSILNDIQTIITSNRLSPSRMEAFDPIYYLSEVHNIECSVKGDVIQVTWLKPWNIPDSIGESKLIEFYQIILKSNELQLEFKPTQSPLQVTDSSSSESDQNAPNNRYIGLKAWIIPHIFRDHQQRFRAFQNQQPASCDVL